MRPATESARASGRSALLPVVLAVGAALGLLVAIPLAREVSLPYASRGIEGWLARHAYAKETDYVRFGLLLGLPLAGAGLAWMLWVAATAAFGSPRVGAVPLLLAPALWALVPPGTTSGSAVRVLAVGLGALPAIWIGMLLARRWLAARERGDAADRSALLAAFAAGAAVAVVWRIRFEAPRPFIAIALIFGVLGSGLELAARRLRPGTDRAHGRACAVSVVAGAALLALLPVPTLVAIGAPVLLGVGIGLFARAGFFAPSEGEARVASVLAACAVLYALLADLVLAATWEGAVDLYHEGESLLPAAAYARGAVPYRDVAPLHGYFTNGGFTQIAFALFGETIEVRRIAEWALHPLGAAAVLALAFASLRSRILAAAGVLSVLLVPLRPELRHAFGLASSALLVAGVGAGKRAPFLLSGAAASFALLVSLDVGLYALVGGSLFLAAYAAMLGERERRREGLRGLVFFALGAGVVGVGWGGWLASRFAVQEFFEHTVREVPRSQTAIWGTPLPDLFGVWRGVPVLGNFFPAEEAAAYEGIGGTSSGRFARDFLVLPAVLIVGLAFLLGRGLARRWGTVEWKGLALAIPALLALRSALGQPDRVHFAFALPWAWVLFLQSVESAAFAMGPREEEDGNGGEARALVGAAFLFALALFVRTCDPWGYWKGVFGEPARETREGDAPRWLALRPKEDPVPELARLGRVRIPQSQAEAILELKRFLDASAEPGEAVFDFANAGALLFLLERSNPTRFAQAIYASSPALRAEVVRALHAKQVRWAIVRGGGMDVVDDVSNAERLPEVWNYLRANFEPAGSPGGFEVWRRR